MDRLKGIFMVRKSVADSIAFPVHVRKTNRKEEGNSSSSVFCENEVCMMYMNVEWKIGIPVTECTHLQNVTANCIYKESVT